MSDAAYVGKTVNTLHERFHGSNGHLNPSTKSSALLEHLSLDLSPTCEFNPNKIKVLDSCRGDLQLRYAESIHLKHSKQSSALLEPLSRHLSPTCEFNPEKIKVLYTCRGDLQL